MHFHWQNLNEEKRDILHGRAWWHFGKRRRQHPDQKTIQIAWRVGRWEWIGLRFTHGAEEMDYGLSFALGFVSLYLQLSGFRDYNAMQRCVFGYDTGITMYGRHLSVQWNNDASERSYNTDSRGRKIHRDAHGWSRHWDVADVLLGRAVYSSQSLSYSGSFITMPERMYTCTVKLHRDTWKRPRWPWPVVIDRATIDIPIGIPIPGKGTESYNCGEDRIYGLTTPAKSLSEALDAVRRSAENTRLKRGGPSWKPEPSR